MKTNLKSMFRKIVTVTLMAALLFTLSNASFAVSETWNQGQKVNFIPSNEDSSYKASGWIKNLVDLYQLTWFENPTREVLKGEFMLVQLRTIQASLERRNLTLLSAPKETLNFKDNNTLTSAAQEEAKILKSLGILSGNSDGYMKINVPIKRSEAARVLAVTNSKVLKIPSIRESKVFTDTKGHWSEKSVNIAYQICLLNGVSATNFNPDNPLTLEQTSQILENEVGYYGITRADVAKAMNETFKATLDTSLSNSLVTKNSYVKYEEKMKTYGFDQLYDNKSAKTIETVTKSEAVKLALAVIFNVDDAHDFGPLLNGFGADNNEYANANWIDYARYEKILKDDINITNYSDKAKYIDVISFFENCKVKFLEDYSVKDAKVYLKDISKYSLEEQVAIKDMVAYGIIYPLADNLNGNDYIFKGQLNELVVNFAEKYSTIAIKGDKINTDPEKMPSSASQYPYILSNTDKSVYEFPFFRGFSERFLTAKEVYAAEKEKYPQIKEYAEGHFNTILNIDYRTITEESLTQQLQQYYIFAVNKSAIKLYVKYVKNNEIIIEGKSEMQQPVVYFDGVSYRVRMNLTFTIKHSKTKQNLLYLDLFDGLSKTYEKDSYDFIADYYLAVAINDESKFYLGQDELFNTIQNKDICGITKEAEE